jgi:PhnB protein
MSVKPYLIFNGNCREAMDFYREVFGADEPVVMTYGDLPKGFLFPLKQRVSSCTQR